LMLILEVWHPDVVEFINAKRDMDAITNANISVGLTDEFEQALKDDADWDLVFPDYEAVGSAVYDREWDGNLRRWREKGYPVKVYRTMKARDLWKMLIDAAWASAEPGIVRIDYANRMSDSYYFEDLISTNPCVTGDTLIYTDGGLRRAEDLFFEGQARAVAVDGRLSPSTAQQASPVFLTGRKAVYRLRTREGFEVRLTEDHQIMTDRGWVEARDLRPGDRLHVLNRKGLFGTEGNLELGQALGWLASPGGQGDPAFPPAGAPDEGAHPLSAQDKGRGTPLLSGPFATAVSLLPVAHGLLRRGMSADVPDSVLRGNEAMQRGFLQAVFTAGGDVESDRQAPGRIRLAAPLPLLQGVQRLLLNFGIYSRIAPNPHTGASLHEGVRRSDGFPCR